jgi:hypothetical protein
MKFLGDVPDGLLLLPLLAFLLANKPKEMSQPTLEKEGVSQDTGTCCAINGGPDCTFWPFAFMFFPKPLDFYLWRKMPGEWSASVPCCSDLAGISQTA